eukprot:GHVQ01004916.1.p1 GENE.GHVQ01004916.1~~GHVQ01004916.1.p1  ORF type:complete len:287 (+),score=49.32 GHVQ01004916.1:173-1033(+)
MSTGRPEYQKPPEFYYNAEEASKYQHSSRIREIQAVMTRRAIELCLLPPTGGSLVLDVGCGCGISGDILAESGHVWVGLDISTHMLEVAVEEEAQGDMILADAGAPLKFRPGSFDGAISISAIQWLCNADQKHHEPFKRLLCFFRWLYQALRKGARAVFQFYPDSPQQAEMITSAAMRGGFGGGLVVDYPNSTKAKKFYLCLWSGMTGLLAHQTLPQGIQQGEDDNNSSAVVNATRDRQEKSRKQGKKVKKGTKEWILIKKERQRHQGHKVRPDTKYTGRKRKDKF